jgi:hypothetical protein
VTLGVVFSLVDNASSEASLILRSWDELRVSFDYGLLDSLMHGTDTAPRPSTVVSVLLPKEKEAWVEEATQTSGPSGLPGLPGMRLIITEIPPYQMHPSYLTCMA